MNTREKLFKLIAEVEESKSKLLTLKLRMIALIQRELVDRKGTWCTCCHRIVPVSAVEHLLEYTVNEGKGGIITPSFFNRICSSCNTPYNFNWDSQWSNAGGERCRQFHKVKKEPDGYYFEKDNKWLPLPVGYLERFYMTEELMSKLIGQLFP